MLSLLIPAIFAANLIALLLAIQNLRAPAASGPSYCANCGYPTTGLPGFICPECGKDRREIGVTFNPADAQKPRFFKVVVALCYIPLATLLALFVVGFSASAILGHWPVPNVNDPSLCLPPALDALAFIALTGWAWCQILIFPFCAIAMRRRYARHVIAFVVANLLCAFAVFCPPFDFLKWLVD